MPETTENYHRIPVSDEVRKHKGHKLKTITVSKNEGITALYCVTCKKIITYIFDREKWTMTEAKKWVKEHTKYAHVLNTLISIEYKRAENK